MGGTLRPGPDAVKVARVAWGRATAPRLRLTLARGRR